MDQIQKALITCFIKHQKDIIDVPQPQHREQRTLGVRLPQGHLFEVKLVDASYSTADATSHRDI